MTSAHEVLEILESYGLTREPAHHLWPRSSAIRRSWVDWMMRFELGLEEPEPGRAVRSAGTIAASYIAGGLIPLAPYHAHAAVAIGLALFRGGDRSGAGGFGYVKGRFTGAPSWKSAFRTTLIGGVAAAAAFAIAKIFTT